MRIPPLAIVAVTAVVWGCGTSPPPEPRERPRTAAPVQTQTGPVSPWDEVTIDQLSKMVTDAVHARLAQVQPDFDVSKIADYRGAPDSAPALGGRAVDALLDLATVDLVAGRLEEAEKTVLMVRARARNRNDNYAGVPIFAEAKRRAAGPDREEQQRTVERVLGELPRARFNAATLLYEQYRNVDQVLAELRSVRGQTVTPEGARRSLYLGQVVTTIVNERRTYLAAIEAVRLGRRTDPMPPRFQFSAADISKRRAAKLVHVGVWDLGVNPDSFEGKIYATADRENGEDDDRDGVVDNRHGIVFDGEAPQSALLFDPGADVLTQYGSRLRGIMDLRCGLAESDDGQQLLVMRDGITDEAARAALDRNLDGVVEWARGTHAAGTLLDGISKVRMSIFRSAWMGNRPYPGRGPTDEELAAERRNMEQVATYLQKNGVTVVLVGFSQSLAELEAQVRAEQGRYGTDEEVAARARQIHDFRKESWKKVFEAAEGTLFVVPAGDENRNVTEYEVIPASIEMANVLPVGAIDAFGDWAIFTDSGERVRLFHQGVEVESTLPNGEAVMLSGTAVAAANVANVAAKMMSLNNLLMPSQVIDLLVANSTELGSPWTGRVPKGTEAVNAAWTARGRRRAPAL